MQKIILKGSTLLLFFSLVTGFVVFRSGFFGDSKTSYPSSPNGSALNNQTDTIIQEMMHSSKTLIIRDFSPPGKSDSNRINIDSLLADSTFKINPLIYSSKSAIIMEPEDLKLFRFDSLKIDTSKTK
tara:strand:- start:397 stop:777 length:381 start_codon:yes stop_codon:yes gene_type:complete